MERVVNTDCPKCGRSLQRFNGHIGYCSLHKWVSPEGLGFDAEATAQNLQDAEAEEKRRLDAEREKAEAEAALRPQGLEPGATSLSEMVAMFDGVGGFTRYSAIDVGEDVHDIFTFDFIRDTLAAGDPILIGWNDWGGHWQVIIGYDTMGTETTQDDVIIVADPYDTTDHDQDGYGVYGAERFLYNFTFYNFFEGDELNDMCFLVAKPA